MTALPDWGIASDAELACSAAAGDRTAFATIYDRYADRLHDFCIGMVRDREAAADCVQDVFCTAATELGKLREPDKLRPWLYAIARNEALRCIRDRGREQVTDELPEMASADPDPDTLAARTELADLIAQAAGGLSDRDRAVLELTYRHGLDGPALGQALGVNAGTANKALSRLRNTVEHSLGALLVARRAHHNPQGCPELAALLADWDGRFTILMRKRIARHIESCAVCEQDRRQLVSPSALLGAAPVFISAPDWLRERTLSHIQWTPTSASTSISATGSADPAVADGHSPAAAVDDVRSHRARRLLPLFGTLAACLVIAIAWLLLHHRNSSVAPAHVPAIVTPPAPTLPVSTGATANLPPAPPPPFSVGPPTSVITKTTVAVTTTTPASPPPQNPATTTTPVTTSAVTTTKPATTTPTTSVRVFTTPPTTPSHDHPPTHHLS